MKIAFSFCVYGDSNKYCQGMTENIKLINEHYSDFFIHIYIYNNVPTHYIETYKSYKNVVLHHQNTPPNMIDRFFLLDDDDTIDIMLVRDSDSRVHSRDRFCINHFIESNYLSHTIRDHLYHHSHIMGGLWGLKRGYDISIKKIYFSNLKHEENIQYGYDMEFLKRFIYPILCTKKHLFIVYTFRIYNSSRDLRISDDEVIHFIPNNVENKDFCGQVIYYDGNNNPIKQFNHPI